MQRTIQNNFLDNNKQEAIDILLLSGYVGELGWKTRALLSTSDALGVCVCVCVSVCVSVCLSLRLSVPVSCTGIVVEI